uniref:F5/8 type C domain-containing protein n=1 Tax=Alexandrium catenella TaxID=2925 RepID=A0A7S1LK49_ALECA
MCIVSRDRDVCCEDAAYCADHYTCPHSYTLQNDTYCDGPTCEVVRDLPNCCVGAMPCTAITCPWNHIHTPDRYCPATVCVYAQDVDWCCETGVPIRFIRFIPLQLRAITTDDLLKPVVQLAEFTLYFHNTRTALDTATAYAINADYPRHESPQEAIDNNVGTKWLDYQSTPFFVAYASTESFDTFALTTANDVPTRDPVGWRVEGSLDGNTYVLLHEIMDAFSEVPTARHTETRHFRIGVPCLGPKPDIVDGASPLCAEGVLVGSGSTCTPVCAGNYTPSETSLNCTGGLLEPPTFLCL